MRHLKSALPITTGLALLAIPGLAQQYHSNDLTPPYASAGKLQGTRSGKQVGGGSNSHAYLLSGNALTSIDLHPVTGYYSSMATSTDGLEQCGYSGSSLGGIHAMKWSGSSSSAVDLHPSGFNFSYCTSVDNGEQGGFAEQQSYFVTMSHAMVWHGSSAAVDLHPVGHLYSRVMGVKNGEQVGYGSSLAYPYGDYTVSGHTGSRALRWNGTAASVVNLHPAGYDASEALATNGTRQGGWGYRALDGRTHAMLWTGTADSAVDLHPAGYSDSKITAIFDNRQVGEGWVGIPGQLGAVRHALLWTGTAESVVDLNQYLPAGYTHAVATGIDADGNVVGYAYNTYLQGMGVGGDSIAVVFAPGQAAAAAVTSITVTPSNVAPGAALNAVVTLGGAAPAGGVALTFLSTNVNALATPASVTVAEGQTSVTIPLTALGSLLTSPTTFKLFVSDGSASKVTPVTVTPVVKLSSVNINAVEGGFGTTGSIALSIPAQAGGAVVTLTSSNPALVTVPASVSVTAGYTTAGFAVTTKPVTAVTSVPVTATFNGTTVTANVSVNPAPVVSLSSINATSVVGGQTITGSVLLNNFVRDTAGATVALFSGDAAVQVPATVFIPQGSTIGTFTATTSVVPGSKGVSLRASYNGSQATTTVTLSPLPMVTILTADYKPSTMMLKVDATTSYANSTLTYGSNGVAFGTMQLEAGIYQGSIVLPSAPATVTVWNSVGGEATMPVTLSVSSGGGGGGGGTSTGGGGGGGGGSTTTTYKLAISTPGKGTVTTNPAGVTFASGTVVTLTAKPDPGAPWRGWSGACTGTSFTCTLTMNSDKSVTATFK